MATDSILQGMREAQEDIELAEQLYRTSEMSDEEYTAFLCGQSFEEARRQQRESQKSEQQSCNPNNVAVSLTLSLDSINRFINEGIVLRSLKERGLITAFDVLSVLHPELVVRPNIIQFENLSEA